MIVVRPALLVNRRLTVRTADRGEERFVGYVVRLVLANRQECTIIGKLI